MTDRPGRALPSRASARLHVARSASRLLFLRAIKMKPLLLLACLCAACAGTVPAPTARLDQAIGLERDAWGLAALDDPYARAAVTRASAEIDRTMELVRAGDNAAAQQMATRAHVDAELALQLSREAIVRRHATHARAAWMASRER